MKWQAYEELVKDVYQQLGKAVSVTIECWGPSCKVQGKSGTYHQIDVLASHDDGIHKYRTAIECKYWNKKIPKGHVLELSGKITDANIEKGILVSKYGFTRDAITIAKSNNIGLVQLRRSMASDWDGYIKVVSGELNYIFDEVYGYQLICKNPKNNGTHTKQAVISEISVDLTNGVVLPVHDIAERVRKSAKSSENNMGKNGFSWIGTSSLTDEETSYVVKFPTGTVLRYVTMEQGPHVKELRFKIKQTVLTTHVQIDHQDFVAWIMQAIFEDKTFAISPEHAPTQWK